MYALLTPIVFILNREPLEQLAARQLDLNNWTQDQSTAISSEERTKMALLQAEMDEAEFNHRSSGHVGEKR